MRRGALVALSCLGLCCVPWTVVPIDEETPPAQRSDPISYVESIWDSQLLPAVTKNALDLATARSSQAAGEGPLFLVRGKGLVLQHDTRSRSGKLLIDVEPLDGEADFAVLVGPVILGTSLRDAVGFINFTDFANQLAFADVANELNRRVLETVVARVDLDALQGSRVTFQGACTFPSTGLPEVTPVILEAE
jgi:predicted lipoprotein